MPSQRRGPWTNTEDVMLIQLVEAFGPLNWVRIAQVLGSRTPKQCRERYHQNLKPTLIHDPITPEEGALIEDLVKDLGKRWAEIARRLHGRSDNAVKNWWNGNQNRRRRSDRRQAMQLAAAVASYENTMPQASPLVANPTFALPQAKQTLPPLSVPRHHLGGWGEAPLPSPCSSESPESESGSNYTTSPAGRARSLSSQIDLPPLQSWPSSHMMEPQLPRFSSFSQLGQTLDLDNRLPPLRSRTQLPTAPTSPAQLQARPSDNGRDESTENKSDRMKLAALLD